MATSAQPGPSALLDSWFEGWAAAANGAANMWTTMCTRPTGPLDISRWLDVLSTRDQPTWTSPNTVVFARVEPQVTAALQERYAFYVWDEAAHEVRWMCSWDTTAEDVDAFVGALRDAVGIRV